VLGALFLVAATFGTVTDDDVAAAAALEFSGPLYYFHDETRTELPAILHLSKTHEPRLLCSLISEAKVDTSNTRVSNRLGKALQSVLNTLEWGVGLFYDIHFPTALEATAKQVRDPNFGQQDLERLQADYNKQMAVLSDRDCSASIMTVFRNDPNAEVCAIRRFWRLPHREKRLVVGVYPLCIVPVGTKKAQHSSYDNSSSVWSLMPLRTKMKLRLGILRAEVEQKSAQ
jgi:hypothetical protein